MIKRLGLALLLALWATSAFTQGNPQCPTRPPGDSTNACASTAFVHSIAGGLANPTALVGLTAVNGSATTGIRSDGAPALSQAIIPTWTGLHTFTNNIRLNNGSSAAPSFGFAGSTTSGVYFNTGAASVGIADAGFPVVEFASQVSPVNYLQITNSHTNQNVILTPIITGSDTQAGVSFQLVGDGSCVCIHSAVGGTAGAHLALYESGVAFKRVTLSAPATLAFTYDLVMPTGPAGTANRPLADTTGGGILGFVPGLALDNLTFTQRGSASAPALNFGDAQTGLWSTAVDNLDFTVSGTTILGLGPGAVTIASATVSLGNTIGISAGTNSLCYDSGSGRVTYASSCTGILNLVVGTSTVSSGTSTRVLYDNSGVLGEYTNAQLTGLINIATSSLTGALPAWPNNTTTFFRGDGAYAAVGLPAHAAQATNTVVGNATSGSAAPTALAVGSCSTASSALTWTTNTGFGCNTSITAAAVPASGLTGSTLAAGVTASSLTSVGTLAGLTVTGSLTATGLVTNADLVNSSITVNGTTCTLGSSCTPAPAVTSKVVNTSYDLTTASGNQIVSGFGFTPSSCSGFGSVTGSAIGVYTTFNGQVDSALTQSVLYGSGSSINIANNDFFLAVDATATNTQVGIVTAYASNQITIAWTKTGVPTGTFNQSIRCFK